MATERRKFGGLTAYFAATNRIPSPVFIEIDGLWWRCVSSWGPVASTGILVYTPGDFL